MLMKFFFTLAIRAKLYNTNTRFRRRSLCVILKHILQNFYYLIVPMPMAVGNIARLRKQCVAG